jgi:hypothetical protein
VWLDWVHGTQVSRLLSYELHAVDVADVVEFVAVEIVLDHVVVLLVITVVHGTIVQLSKLVT